MTSAPLKSFVRSAWALVLFQVFAAALAVAVTAWAAFQVRPLLSERDRLADEIAVLEQASAELSTANARLQTRLASAREASRFVSFAIEQYHNRRYVDAVRYYDEALRLDPENAYVLDLKSYSQYRAGDLEGAVASINAALRYEPGFIYGYSDLARYACAARQYEGAVDAYARARRRSANEALVLFGRLLREDAQFASVCAPVADRFGP